MFHCRQLEYIYYKIKYRNRCSSKELRDKDNIETLHYKYYYACSFSVGECFLEAAPQLTIQVYIILQHLDDDTRPTGMTGCVRHATQVQLNIIDMTAVIIKKTQQIEKYLYSTRVR